MKSLIVRAPSFFSKNRGLKKIGAIDVNTDEKILIPTRWGGS